MPAPPATVVEGAAKATLATLVPVAFVRAPSVEPCIVRAPPAFVTSP